MSDILIQDIKMPTGEDEGILLAIYDGKVYQVGTKREYTAVEVPPHRRLIDADALKRTLIPLWNCNDDQDFANKCVWRALDDAPTIIPASHEDEA